MEASQRHRIIGQLPIVADLTNWRLKVPKSKKLWICAGYYILHALHSLFTIGSLMYFVLFVPDLQLHQLMIHAISALWSAMCTLWYYLVYVQDPMLFAKYAEWTLVGNVGGTPDPKDGLKNHWTRRLGEYSIQDLIGTIAPYSILATSAVVCATYVHDPTMKALLYNSMPSYLQNWLSFGLLLVEEVRFLVLNACIASPIWQLHTMSFDLVGNRLLALKRKIENGTVTRTSTYKILRSLQMYVSIFNNVNSYMIFTGKLLSIGGSILAGFAAVAHFGDRPIFGIMYYMIFFNCVFMYAVIYEKAFKIPQLFDETASRALLCMCGNRKGAFRRHISSIPHAAIKVGKFHKMERTSTPTFIHFVVTNIVSMLVAFG